MAESLGVEGQELWWSGLMPDYTLPVINDPYFSTLFSGVFGFILVLGAAF